MTPAVVFVGLGSNQRSNVGEPLETLEAAVWSLDDLDGVAVDDTSAVYRTPPWPPANDSRSVVQGDFLNMVVKLVTRLTPHDLLVETQELERAFGRDRAREVRWGPRPLDVDILLHGELQVCEPDLEIPHPRLAERAFVLLPLIEIFPGGRLPDGRGIAALLNVVDGLDGIELEMRFDEIPSRHIRRPDGPQGAGASFDRPPLEDYDVRHFPSRSAPHNPDADSRPLDLRNPDDPDGPQRSQR